jgi:8-oxo-dGTP pyrophosphatase MutT (NUDIX family)
MILTPPWPALAAARQRARPRRAFVVDDEVVGSIDEAHLPAIARWPAALAVAPDAVRLRLPREERDAWFAEANAALRAEDLVRAWRDEPFALPSPASGRTLAVIERAASRFWGTLTLGAHCNGWVAGPDGRPAQMWIARRSPHKPTDPGKLDNLVGGGVPIGQTPWEALLREGWEEAGLPPQRMAQATSGRVLELRRDIPEGLHVYDLELLPGEEPVNQDGEVASVELLPCARAAEAAAGHEMTVDAALVALDFLLRQALLAGSDTALQAAFAACLAGVDTQRPPAC